MEYGNLTELVTTLLNSKCQTCVHKHNSEPVKKEKQSDSTITLINSLNDTAAERNSALSQVKELKEFIEKHTNWNSALNACKNKIEAVKFIRKVTNLDLRSAKTIAEKKYYKENA